MNPDQTVSWESLICVQICVQIVRMIGYPNTSYGEQQTTIVVQDENFFLETIVKCINQEPNDHQTDLQMVGPMDVPTDIT